MASTTHPTTITRCLALKLPSSSGLRRTTTVKSQLRHSLTPLHHRDFSATSPALGKRYTPDHEWIDLSPGAKLGTVGISTYAAHALGDVVYVELPTPSESVSAGDVIGAVESVKSASDIKAPVAGVVAAVNELLESNPSVMGMRPEDGSEQGGWIAKIEVSEGAAAEVERLMGEEEYRAFVNE